MKSKVYIKIPGTGLGNCMLVWAQGIVFAKLNGLEYVTGRWWKFRWGALVRREKKSRLYKGYFNETSIFKRIRMKWHLLFSEKVIDPEIKVFEQRNPVFVLTQYSAQKNMFRSLINQQDFVKQELLKLLVPSLKEKYLKCSAPVIGVHVRRGDFKIANPVTPISWFMAVIGILRENAGEALPAVIFTDADADEITDLMRLPNVFLSENKEDILDILQMSKSKYLVLSRSSTFSYWAAFLSQGVVIMRDDDWQGAIKPANGTYRELRCRDPYVLKEILKN